MFARPERMRGQLECGRFSPRRLENIGHLISFAVAVDHAAAAARAKILAVRRRTVAAGDECANPPRRTPRHPVTPCGSPITICCFSTVGGPAPRRSHLLAAGATPHCGGLEKTLIAGSGCRVFFSRVFFACKRGGAGDRCAARTRGESGSMRKSEPAGAAGGTWTLVSRQLVNRALLRLAPSASVGAACRRLSTGLPGPADQDSPIFVLGSGWRTGSTLVQRMINATPGTLIWGEPYSEGALVQRLAESIAFLDPENGRFNGRILPDDAEPPGGDEWTANLTPPLARMVE